MLQIPEEIKAELDKYRDGQHPYPFGSFITAVLSNDLVGAFASADGHNTYAMKAYAEYLYNELRRGYNYGSYEIVAAEIERQQHAYRDAKGGG